MEIVEITLEFLKHNINDRTKRRPEKLGRL